jgi:hypothetical protein
MEWCRNGFGGVVSRGGRVGLLRLYEAYVSCRSCELVFPFGGPDYGEQLAAGVDVLSTAGVNVSVYNLPLCVLDLSVRPFAVQSISDWKNAYVAECDGCSARRNCAGFFSTATEVQSWDSCDLAWKLSPQCVAGVWAGFRRCGS